MTSSQNMRICGTDPFTFTWHAENRLLRVQSRSDTPQGSWRRVEWQYDALGRRIRQTTWSWLVQSNLWVMTEDLGMVSDPLLYGRHLLELNATNVLARSYVWGLDLSGTLEGAGGVGGLLWVTLHTASDPAAGTHFVAYDGNGNIVALSGASDGSPTARYEYGPFGQPIRVSGPAAALNPFRFSTKRTDSTTDLVLYEYRAYSPSTGRWSSRDPLRELGWIVATRFRDASVSDDVPNPYYFVGNSPTRSIDLLGLQTWCGTCETYGAGSAVALQFLECYLTTPCDAKCKYEFIHVKAWFVAISASALPVNYTEFRTCFGTPDGSDHTAFNGAARFVTITVSPGAGKAGGKVVLGDAESEGVADTLGIDWSASFGAGRSRVRSHYTRSCK